MNMTSYTVKQNDNLWKIVKREYGLTNDKDIANKVNELAKANHMSSPNTIFVGKTINLVGKNDANTASAAGTDNAKSTESVFGNWTEKCDDSTQSKDVKDFDIAGNDFGNAVKKGDYKGADVIYSKKVLDTARDYIKIYDTDGDGTISREEQIMQDKTKYEAKNGKADSQTAYDLSTISLRKSLFIDLNKDGKVDEKEYSAYLYAMDSNNKDEVADGKISKEEYLKTEGYTKQKLTQEAGNFKGRIRSCFRGLYGYDPKAKGFSEWTNNDFASAVESIAEDGTVKYSKDVKDFEITNEEETEKLQKLNGLLLKSDHADKAELAALDKEATFAYKKDVLGTATRDMTENYHTKVDGEMTEDEYVASELEQAKQSYSPEEWEHNVEMQKKIAKEHFKTLNFDNNDGKNVVDSTEYGAFLWAMDANNSTELADGRVTKEEYSKTSLDMEDKNSDKYKLLNYKMNLLHTIFAKKSA